MEVRDLPASRRFYEEFLGLDCVRHHPFAIDRAHTLAHEVKERYGIKTIMPVTDQQPRPKAAG